MKFSRILSMGLTNSSSEDYGSVASGKRKLVATAYCTSHTCCTYQDWKTVKTPNGEYKQYYKNLLKSRVEKKVQPYKKECPDCSSVLQWRME